jgi:hypothetical protein
MGNSVHYGFVVSLVSCRSEEVVVDEMHGPGIRVSIFS